ncbi:hypothetical protein OG216_28715 [Streptomycetaceae bacterium NBC_01309]
MMMIKRVGAGLGRAAAAGTMAACTVAAGALVVMVPGTAVAVSADGGDAEGVTVWRAPGQAQTLTGEVWTMRGCAYGILSPHIGMSCRYEVLV